MICLKPPWLDPCFHDNFTRLQAVENRRNTLHAANVLEQLGSTFLSSRLKNENSEEAHFSTFWIVMRVFWSGARQKEHSVWNCRPSQSTEPLVGRCKILGQMSQAFDAFFLVRRNRRRSRGRGLLGVFLFSLNAIRLLKVACRKLSLAKSARSRFQRLIQLFKDTNSNRRLQNKQPLPGCAALLPRRGPDQAKL